MPLIASFALTLRRRSPLTATTLALSALLALTSGPSLAQYKVVDADGRVTYTDRPPAATPNARITPVRRDGLVAADNSGANFPLELRQASARFPVTLYTATDCPPCDSARRLLRTRGIPFIERLINEDDDATALQQLSGGRTVPTLTVGGQVIRVFAESDWHNMLDLAGYPRESRLPRGYSAPPATPLATRAAQAPASVPEPAAAPRPLPTPPPAAPSADPAEAPGPAIRF